MNIYFFNWLHHVLGIVLYQLNKTIKDTKEVQLSEGHLK